MSKDEAKYVEDIKAQVQVELNKNKADPLMMERAIKAGQLVQSAQAAF